MASMLKARLGNLKMAFRGSGHVDNVRFRFPEQGRQIAEGSFNCESLAELLGHQRFTIASSDNRAPRNPLELRGVRIRDLAATHYGDSKHLILCLCRTGNISVTPRPSELLESNRAPLLLSGCYTASFSNRRAIFYGCIQVPVVPWTMPNISPTNNKAHN